MKYVVEFSGKILVEARNEDDALYTLGQLTGGELLDAIDSTHAEVTESQDIRFMTVHKAEDYL